MTKTVEIALVGKYTSQQDTYTSIIKSLEHAGLESNRKVVIKVLSNLNLFSLNITCNRLFLKTSLLIRLI